MSASVYSWCSRLMQFYTRLCSAHCVYVWVHMLMGVYLRVCVPPCWKPQGPMTGPLGAI